MPCDEGPAGAEDSQRDRMNVKAKLFAGIRELAGASRVAVDLPDRATVPDLGERLASDYP